jgi:hypothetical protein
LYVCTQVNMPRKRSEKEKNERERERMIVSERKKEK